METRDFDFELFTRRSLHQIRAFHESFHSFENAEAVVLMRLARHDGWLFSDDALTFYLLHAFFRVVNKPMTAEELDGFVRLVLDGDKISEDEFALDCIGLSVEEYRANCDFHTFSGACIRMHLEAVLE